ncbi:MAG: hypothetical protein C4298_06760 [Thermus sp.]
MSRLFILESTVKTTQTPPASAHKQPQGRVVPRAASEGHRKARWADAFFALRGEERQALQKHVAKTQGRPWTQGGLP